MAVTQLTAAAPISGTFNASGVSSSFRAPVPLDTWGREGFLSYGQVRPIFSVQATFSSDAAGTLTVTKSKDGGSTFQPIMAGQRVISMLPISGALNFRQLDPAWIYRLEASLSAGSISYSVSRSLAETTIGTIDSQAGGDPNWPLSFNMPGAGYWRICDPTIPNTPRQPSPGLNTAAYAPSALVQRFYETIWTPVQDADLAGTLIGYKTCRYAYTNPAPNNSVTIRNAFAKLSIASDASRSRGFGCYPGYVREIRASAATVTALVDVNNQPVASAYDPYDSTRILTPGATISAPYTDDVRTGIVFMLTLLEAINFQLSAEPSSKGDYPPLPNLAALGV